MYHSNYEEDMRILALTPEEHAKECDDRFRKDAPIWMPNFLVEAIIWSLKPIHRGWNWSLLWSFPLLFSLFMFSLALSIAVIPVYFVYAYYLMARDIWRNR